MYFCKIFVLNMTIFVSKQTEISYQEESYKRVYNILGGDFNTF